jgi:spermidine/putrescine transport system substrate-binding protein
MSPTQKIRAGGEIMRLKGLLLSGALVAMAGSASAADPELIVFDWAGFEDQALISAYHEAHGTGPTYSFFADDDEAFQKLASGFRVDVAHPCSQMIGRYRDAGLIEPWDVSRIPEYENIDPRFKTSDVWADDSGVWFIPTDYAYTAIAHNTGTVPEEDVASLQVFHNPAYAGRISLPDNVDDVWALALLATGVSDWTELNEEQFQAAAGWLRTAHENVRTYWADPSELSQLMVSGEVSVAWAWNDAVALMQAEGFPIGFQRDAEEGTTNWVCGYVNMANAPGSEDKAYDFINAWLDPGSARGLLDGFGYAHSNTAGMATISDEDLEAAFLDPVEGTLLTQEPMDLVMRERMLEEFEMIKAGF